MPELPEAEYMVRRLRLDAPGVTIDRVRVLRPGMTRPQPPRRLAKLAAQQPVTGYGRRAKSVLIELGNAHTIRVQLGMTGHIYHVPNSRDLPQYTRIAFHLHDGSALAFEDSRTFGNITIHPAKDLPTVFAALGPEPLDAAFTPAVLAEVLKSSNAPIKPLLLDQGRVVGLGNIWAAEALWKSRIHPAAAPRDLTPKQIKALHSAIVSVLAKAVENTFKATGKGSDFPEADLLAVAVYQRDGQPCRRCKQAIVRVTQAGRSTFFCPVCQAHRPPQSPRRIRQL